MSGPDKKVNDPLYDFMVDLFDDLSKQADFTEVMVAREHVPRAGNIHSMTVQDRSGKTVFALAVRSIKSQRNRAEIYQVNAVELFVTNEKGNFPDEPIAVVQRDNMNMLQAVKAEVRACFREVVEKLVGSRPELRMSRPNASPVVN